VLFDEFAQIVVENFICVRLLIVVFIGVVCFNKLFKIVLVFVDAVCRKQK
jgi:hypothetical protein